MTGGFVVRHTKRIQVQFQWTKPFKRPPINQQRATLGLPVSLGLKMLYVDGMSSSMRRQNSRTFLQECCCLNKYDEHVLHHNYSTSTTVADKKCVNAVIDYVTKHGNPFDPENSNKLTNNFHQLTN